MRTLSLLILAASLQAATYYANPTGQPSCAGTQACPWDLQTGLTAPLVGGDVLSLQTGTYTGAFTSTLNGNGTQIIVQPQDGPVKIIETGTFTQSTGGWVTYQGIEWTSAPQSRSIPGNDCFYLTAPSINLIHNVIHDCGADGVGFWSGDSNATAYGNLIYYNGYNASDRGHGHGIYMQSNIGNTKLVQDNIVLDNFGLGLHAYTEGGEIDGITYRGNIVFGNGCISTVGCNENLLTGGLVIAENTVWDSNIAYYPSTVETPSADLGYYAGTDHAQVTGNYFLGGQALYEVASANANITGNVIEDWSGGSSPKLRAMQPEKKGGGGGSSCLTGNTCGTPALTVIVRSDLYESGRATVAVMNLGNTVKSVSVPVAALGYANGSTVVVATAEDWFGTHRSFLVSGGAITLPLTGWTVAAPAGWPTPKTTLPEFGAFVLRKQ